jgi:hypothetical protein
MGEEEAPEVGVPRVQEPTSEFCAARGVEVAVEMLSRTTQQRMGAIGRAHTRLIARRRLFLQLSPPAHHRTRTHLTRRRRRRLPNRTRTASPPPPFAQHHRLAAAFARTRPSTARPLRPRERPAASPPIILPLPTMYICGHPTLFILQIYTFSYSACTCFWSPNTNQPPPN